MSQAATEVARIAAEYERRAREVPDDYYALSRPANLLMHGQTLRACIGMLRRASLFPPQWQRILDVGCGGGGWLLELMQWGADPAALCGIDLSPDRIDRARRRIPCADLRAGSASELPWPDESFDLVSQFTVFTSILDAGLKRAVAAEMLRVLRPGGTVLWFDFRFHNPRNPNVRGVGAGEIRSLFPGCRIELAPAVLAPPLARLVAGWSWTLAELLHSQTYLRTHYAGLIQKQ
jgi:ubiquinone/menaquinone biosynthesis C-methylase UbiE